MKEQALVQGHKSIYVRPVIELFSMQVSYCLMASLEEMEEEMKMEQEDARSKEFGGFFDSESTEGASGGSIWEE